MSSLKMLTSTACPIHIWDLNSVITMPANVLATNRTRSSTGTVLGKDVFSTVFSALGILMAWCCRHQDICNHHNNLQSIHTTQKSHFHVWGQTMSKSWLLMPWMLALNAHHNIPKLWVRSVCVLSGSTLSKSTFSVKSQGMQLSAQVTNMAITYHHDTSNNALYWPQQ